uniref:Uncharacterized protein n=1 Tax=Populus alba TaxID=43335 RepID=A0A4U5PQP4_POPAL|nr:hypothetical protein D5086_0000192770 [Populus alba]
MVLHWGTRKVVYEVPCPSIVTSAMFFRGHSRLLCPKAAAASNLVSSSHPQTQAAPSAKGNAFSRLGPQISHQDAPPTPPVQSQSQVPDNAIPIASGVAATSEVDHASTAVWVTVESRRKHSKKSGPSPKGKEVAVSETRVDAPSSPILPVVAQVSAVEISHPVAMAGKTDIAPSLDVSARNGVRTRNQKNRDRGGRVPPSSTLP